MLPVFSTFSNYVTEEYDSHLLDLLIFIQAWISLFDKDMHKTYILPIVRSGPGFACVIGAHYVYQEVLRLINVPVFIKQTTKGTLSALQ